MATGSSDDPVGWAIVAIPEEDDFVWKISSETTPHLTILYLGDQNDPETEESITSYLQHVADTTMTRFGLSVDRRGELGPKNADVLFFDEDYGVKGENGLAAVRESLLKNNQILDAYNSVTQYPGWTPHLTLGFPETPAKPDNRDYPGIHWVNFDRVALWTGDSTGPTFDLKRDNSMAMSEWTPYDRAMVALTAKMNVKPEDAVQFGRRGMKWGVIHPRGANGRVTISEDAKGALDLKQKIAKSGGVHGLSNVELEKLNKRINLENNYSKAVAEKGTLDKTHAKIKKGLNMGQTLNEAIKFANSDAGRLIAAAVGQSKGRHVKGVHIKK